MIRLYPFNTSTMNRTYVNEDKPLIHLYMLLLSSFESLMSIYLPLRMGMAYDFSGLVHAFLTGVTANLELMRIMCVTVY